MGKQDFENILRRVSLFALITPFLMRRLTQTLLFKQQSQFTKKKLIKNPLIKSFN